MKKYLSLIQEWFSNRHIFLKSLIIVIIIQATHWILYLFTSFTRRDFLIKFEISQLYWPILLTFPSFILWFWRSTLSSQLKMRLERTIPNGGIPDSEIDKMWHIPVSLLILTIFVFPVADYWLGGEYWKRVGYYSPIYPIIHYVIAYGISIFFLSMSILRYLHLIKWFKNQIRRGIQVQPLHPDQCGGLAFIGSMLLKFVLFMFAFTLLLLFYYWDENEVVYIIIAGICYLLIIWYFIINPSMLVHSSMKKIRDDLLYQISLRFGKEIKKVKTNNKRTSVLLQRIQENHNIIIQTYPLWPFTLPWGRVLGVVGALPPIVATALSIISLWD